MYLSKRNHVFYLWYIDERGKKCKVSTGSSSKRLAYEFLRTFQQDKKESVRKSISLTQLKQEVMAYVEGSYAPGTAKLYGAAWRNFLNLVGDIGINEVVMRHADRFKVARLKSVSPVTTNMHLRILRASFGMAVRWGFIDKNPFSMVRLASVHEKAPEYFSVEEFDKFISVIDRKWFRDIVTFVALTGCRQSEVLNLKWEDVDLDRRVVRIQSSASFKTKTGKMRVLPLSNAAWTLLNEVSKEEHRDFVFLRAEWKIDRYWVNHLFQRYVKKLGTNKHLTYNSLRHSHASWLALQNVSIYKISKLLGHSDVKVTQKHYAHLESSALRDVVEKLQINSVGGFIQTAPAPSNGTESEHIGSVE